jgi:NUMOD3 motif
MEDNNYYVYRHIRLDSNTPFYVGKGKGNRAFKQRNRTPYWRNIVNKVGFEVEIFLENLTEEQAFEKEREFIKLYRGCGYQLANLTDGGEGPSGRVFSEEAKNKIRQAQIGRKHSSDRIEKNREMRLNYYKNGGKQSMTGKKQSPETIEKYSQAQLKRYAETVHPMQGKRHTTETKEKISKAQLGQKRSPLSKEHIQKIKDTKARQRQEKLKLGAA